MVQQIGGIGGFDYHLERDEAICTPELYALLGIPVGTPITLETWAAVVHPDDRDRIVEEVRESIEARRGVSQVYRIVRPDNGETRWVSGQSAVLPDENGDALRYVGGLIDITGTKYVEDNLREATRQLDAILNNTQMAIFMMDSQQHCVFMNRAAEELTGYSLAETAGRPLHNVIHHLHPDGRPYPLEECPIDRAFPDRNQVQGEEIFVHKDGHFYPVAFTASPIRNDQGEPIGTIIEARDITARRREEMLRDAQNSVLELAIANRPLSDPLGKLIATVEACSSSGLIGSILLLEDGHLLHGAAARLPTAYIEAIDGLKIGPEVGSCGSAAFHKKPVHVSDIASDQRWACFRELALGHGLRACWSNPILSGKGDVLGTFAMYYPEPRDAPPEDLDLVEFVTRAASLVIERSRAERELHRQANALSTLNRVGATIAAELDLEKIVQMVTDSGVALSGAAFGAFFYNVKASDQQAYMLYTLSGAARSDFERFPMPRVTEVFHPTFSGTGVVRSDDIHADPRYGRNAPFRGMPAGHLPVRSYLAVPVVARNGEVLGGLLFGHPEPARFTARHEDLLIGLAGQAAVAIDNSRLFANAQREIAERREAEQAVRDLNATLEQRVAAAVAEREQVEEALRQAQKMEAVGQLTGGIAHDFNNLLTIICGNVDNARRRLGDDPDPKLVRALDNAMTGADRAAVLTQRLLAFSRRQPLSPRAADPNRLVKEMSELLHRTLGETIEIETVLDAQLWPVEVDTNQLESAIINLAVNARDAILAKSAKGAGKLTIETANVHFDRDYVAHHAGAKPGQYVLIAISDNGTGMDEATRARVFEPFFTTKEVGKGTGLGLSMVYGFVKQSGGHVTIYSEPGEGTTIRIYLPRLERAITMADEETTAAPVKARDGATVLVCEDDDDVRAYTVDLLYDLGYRVFEARDGKAALETLSTQADVDLLFTDIVLPGGMTGADVAKKARALRPGIKVLYTTGYARNALVHQGRLERGVELITKPFSYSNLSKRISELIG